VPNSYHRPSWRRPLTVLTVLAVLLGIGGYAAYTTYQHFVTRLLTVPGCQAGTGANALPLDFGQAADAAIIAGVAVREHLPRRALAIAYATAFQESKLENLDYGDLDSVGVFQQRPSEGWGPASKLINPVYASTKFFQALAQVRDYRRMPVYKAAQAVQHSADGYAYAQYQPIAAKLTSAFTGSSPRAVWCWPSGAAGTAQFTAARRALVQTFGRLPAHDSASAGDALSLLVRAPDADIGWAVATWLVTHAGQYRLSGVFFAGFRWSASAGGGWAKDKAARASAVVAT
jgi:hypothetical protein